MKRLLGRGLDVIAASRTVRSEWLFRASQRYLLSYLSSGVYQTARNGEDALIRAVARARPLSTVIDVGANVGDWASSVRSALPSATIHCIEAAPDTATRLAASFVNDRNTFVHCAVLSDRAQPLAFRYFAGKTDFSTAMIGQTSDTADSTVLELMAITGAAFCEQHDIDRVDMIKIDCEGYDYSVLRGFGPVIARCPVIQFEHNEFGMRAGVHIDHFVQLLAPTHVVGRLTAAGVVFHDPNSEWISGFLPGNYVAVDRSLTSVTESIGRFP